MIFLLQPLLPIYDSVTLPIASCPPPMILLIASPPPTTPAFHIHYTVLLSAYTLLLPHYPSPTALAPYVRYCHPAYSLLLPPYDPPPTAFAPIRQCYPAYRLLLPPYDPSPTAFALYIRYSSLPIACCSLPTILFLQLLLSIYGIATLPITCCSLPMILLIASPPPTAPAPII
jgi:hypothetical protein